jgi:hypothetical protein
MTTWKAGLALAVMVAGAQAAAALEQGGFGLSVLVDGGPRPEYHGRGQVYVEALRGQEYTLRLTNPLGYRVAVALAVDGLNSIDATHGNARSAAKWVLGPYETIEISGWQVNAREARRFYFTGERESYGAALGQTANLGVIEAVFFRERRSLVRRYQDFVQERARREDERQGRGEAAGAAPSASSEAAPQRTKDAAPAPRDEYAATGMGERTGHSVENVRLELETAPAATLRLRYEFRPQLVRLGLLPHPWHPHTDPLDRREDARGFDGYCPEPGR